jgi:hypothetical protein
MGSTELARTVALLAVDALERSRMKAGRSGCGSGGGGGGGCAASLTVESEACEACALVLGEGFEEGGVEWGMGDE